MAHKASISCVIVFLAAVSWNLLPLDVLEVERLQPFSLFAVFHKVSEVLLIIRKLCGGVFSRKQTLQFAPDTAASCDVSIQLLFSGDSTSLCAHTCETRPLYFLQPMSAGEMNADCFKSLSYEVQKYEFYNKVQFYVHNTKQLLPIEAIKELMNSSNSYVNLQLMKFVLSCFDLRSKLLSV